MNMITSSERRKGNTEETVFFIVLIVAVLEGMEVRSEGCKDVSIVAGVFVLIE